MLMREARKIFRSQRREKRKERRREKEEREKREKKTNFLIKIFNCAL